MLTVLEYQVLGWGLSMRNITTFKNMTQDTIIRWDITYIYVTHSTYMLFIAKNSEPKSPILHTCPSLPKTLGLNQLQTKSRLLYLNHSSQCKLTITEKTHYLFFAVFHTITAWHMNITMSAAIAEMRCMFYFEV